MNEFSSTVLTIYSMDDIDEKEIRILLKYADQIQYFSREEVGYLLWKVEYLRDKVHQSSEAPKVEVEPV